MTYDYIKVERRGHVMMIGINRPEKANAFNLQLCRELSSAYAEFDSDDSMRVGILHSFGNHFTGGMDLPSVAPEVSAKPQAAAIALGSRSEPRSPDLHPYQRFG